MSVSDHPPRGKSAGQEREDSARTKGAGFLSAVIFYGLIALLLFTPIPYGSVEPWSHAVFECAVFALTLLWCVHVILTRTWFSGDLRLFLPLGAAIVFAILQSLSWSSTNIAGVRVLNAISADPYESWIFALRLLALVLAGLLATRFTCDHLRLAILVNTILLIAVLSGIFGIVRLTMQHSSGFLLPSLRYSEGFAQFINKNHFAFLAEPAVGLMVAMILLPTNVGHRKLTYLAGLVLLWAALVLSQSRGALLTVAIQMSIAALFFIYSRRSTFLAAGLSRRTRAIGIAALAFVAIVVTATGTTLWLGGEQLSTGVETAAIEMTAKTGDHHEGARRRDIWRATLQMARAHPIAGAGLGAYWAEIPLYHDASGMLTPQQAHNEYLELLASGGLIGLGLFSWFIVAVVQRIQRALRTYTGVQRALAVGAIIGIVGVAVHSLVDFGLHLMGNALVFVMLLAILSLTPLDQRVMAQGHRNGTFN